MFYQLKFFDPIASDATISAQAGIILGAKTAAQVCTGMLWGRVADAEWGGRRVVLVVGLLSSCTKLQTLNPDPPNLSQVSLILVMDSPRRLRPP